MAKLTIKLLPLVGVVLLFSAIGFFVVKSEKEDVEELSHEEMVSKTDISAKKFKVAQPDSDKGITWTLEADEGDYSYENEVGRFKKFRIKLHTEEGLDFDLEGKNGEFNIEKNELNFSGELKGKTSNRYVVYAEHLLLKGKEGIIKSDEIVTFVGPFFRMTGKGLFMDMKKETLIILKDGKSTFDKESLNI